MAKRQIHSVKEAKAVCVQCAGCRHFRRDTDGISRTIETGEYFMGVCELGLMPDSPVKQFAVKPRICKEYRGR